MSTLPSTVLPPPKVALAISGRACETAAALFELTKPRLAFFSVLTAMTAYATSGAAHGAAHALATLGGTAAAAGGALSLNQWWERDSDRLMRRTRRRPLPADTLRAPVALAWSLLLSLTGVGLLAGAVNLTAAALAAATILIYGVVYTPLKRRSRWATELGSISGALPALLGAAAAGDVSSLPAWTLTAILLFWQMPHFYAIGWMHRDDYRAAGFPLLPAADTTGDRTAGWALGYTVALIIVSIIPVLTGGLGWAYGTIALVAGADFLRRACQFHHATGDRDRSARPLFLGSILYLPLVMAGLTLDRFL